MATNDKSYAVCPLCVRITSDEDDEELTQTIKTHNEQQHDGDWAAEIVRAKELDGFIGRVEDKYGSEVKRQIGKRIVEKDPWGILSE